MSFNCVTGSSTTIRTTKVMIRGMVSIRLNHMMETLSLARLMERPAYDMLPQR